MIQLVWNFFQKISQSEQERINMLKNEFDWNKIYFHDDINDNDYLDSKSLKRLLAISVVNFIVSQRCNFPLHILLSDLVDKYTKSSETCLRILNTLGICVSSTTFDRFQAQKSNQHLQKHVVSNLTPDAFCYVSMESRSSFRLTLGKFVTGIMIDRSLLD